MTEPVGKRWDWSKTPSQLGLGSGGTAGPTSELVINTEAAQTAPAIQINNSGGDAVIELTGNGAIMFSDGTEIPYERGNIYDDGGRLQIYYPGEVQVGDALYVSDSLILKAQTGPKRFRLLVSSTGVLSTEEVT